MIKRLLSVGLLFLMIVHCVSSIVCAENSDVLDVHSNGTAQWHGQTLPCVIGRNGMSKTKREGDGKTPQGLFWVRKLYFRYDRIPSLTTGLPIQVLFPAPNARRSQDLQARSIRVPLPLYRE